MHTALIPKAKTSDIIAVDSFSKEARQMIVAAEREGNEMTLALTTARAIQGLRELVTPEMMTDVIALMNTQLGFDTDRNPARSREAVQPYSVDVVKDCFITARLWGASPVNNEFNIISARAYKTVNFFRRKVREVDGVEDVTTQIGAPEYNQDRTGARVSCLCTWLQDGKKRVRRCLKEDTGDWRISVKVNKGMGDDAIKGKAERKLLALVLADMIGVPEREDEEPTAESPAGFHDPIHTEPQAAYSVGDDIAADAANHVGEQTPAPEPPEAAAARKTIMGCGTAEDVQEQWELAKHEIGVDLADARDLRLKQLAALKTRRA